MRIYLDNNFRVTKTVDASQLTQFNVVPVEVWTTIANTDRTVGMNFVRPDGYKLQQLAFTYTGTQVEETVTYYTWTGEISAYNTAIIPGTTDFGYALLSFTITKVLSEVVVERYTSPILRITVMRSIEPDLPIAPTNSLETLEERVAALEAGLVQVSTRLDFPYPVKADSAITKGQVIMFTGSTGDNTRIAPATSAAVNANPSVIIGVANEDIPANGTGDYEIIWFGELNGINTSIYGANGTVLYFNHAVVGGLTATKPTAPNRAISVAAVKRSASGSSGRLIVRPLLVDENLLG